MGTSMNADMKTQRIVGSVPCAYATYWERCEWEYERETHSHAVTEDHAIE